MHLENTPLTTMRMYSGEYINPWTMTQEYMRLKDVVHSLTLKNRWNGNTTISVPVLLHQVWCVIFALEDGITDRKLLKTILEHDCHEAYMGDMPYPIKIDLYEKFPEYKELDEKLMKLWAEKENLYYPHGEICDKYDILSRDREYQTFLLTPLEDIGNDPFFRKYYYPFTLNSYAKDNVYPLGEYPLWLSFVKDSFLTIRRQLNDGTSIDKIKYELLHFLEGHTKAE